MIALKDILENKTKEIREFKELHGDHIHAGGKPARGFLDAVRPNGFLSVIAEVKRMSPSRGVINDKDSPSDIAKLYSDMGVQAISVLTDKKYFGGGFELLTDVSKTVSVPLLCKDFIVDKIQIDLAKLSGASAVLLIADILEDGPLNELYRYARDAGMDVLMEGHNPENIRRAVETGARIIGINNRDLFTMDEKKKHAIENIRLIPEDRLKFSLSSINSREDALHAAKAGFDGILIGTVLMKAFNKKAAVNSFLSIPLRK